MRIKIIYPEKQGIRVANKVYAPLVLPHLAAITPPQHQVELINLQREPLKEDDPADVVGITAMTSMANSAYTLADRFRERGVPVVLGGPHPTAMPLEALKHADAVVVGEAEAAWPQLLQDLETNQLRKLYVGGPLNSLNGLDPSSVRLFPHWADLSAVPHARRKLLKSKYFFDTLMTSRGCPYGCKFCSTTRSFGPLYRHRPVEMVLEEIKQLRSFWLLTDDDIFGDLDYREELYGHLSKKKRFMEWHGAGSLSVADSPQGRRVLKFAVKGGLTAAMVGIESLSDETLSFLGAKQKQSHIQRVDWQKTKELIRTLQKEQILVVVFFIIGFDDDDHTTVPRILEFCDELKVLPLPFLLYPLPGTSLWETYVSRLYPGVTWDMWDSAHAVYDHPTLSPRQRERMIYELRMNAVTWGRVFRRLGGLSIGAKIFSFMLQMGFRKGFDYDRNVIRQLRQTAGTP